MTGDCRIIAPAIETGQSSTRYTSTASAAGMQGLPDIKAEDTIPVLIDGSALPKFDRKTLHRPRRREQYKAPLVIVRLSPGEEWQTVRAHLSMDDCVYVESFSGFSTFGHEHAELLARYLLVFVHSSVWLHFALATCPQYGAERNKLREQTVDAVPFVPIESLSEEECDGIGPLAERLIAGDVGVYDAIDAYFAGVFRLTSQDMEVVKDSLETARAYRGTSGRRACLPPSWAERKRLMERVRKLLAPFYNRNPDDIKVTAFTPKGSEDKEEQTFGAIVFGAVPDADIDELYYNLVLPLADEAGAARVIIATEKSSLLVGIRNQYRYWTPTRARLLSADILRDLPDALES